MSENKIEDLPNAVIYLRVSSKKQADEGYSIPSQEVNCKNYAQLKKFNVAKIFIDEGVSATIHLWNRPSGKANEGGRKGVFFCYRIPEPVSLSDEEIERGVVPGWSTEDGMGESLWFFYDTEAEEILDQIGQMSEMHKIIECSTETERVISLDDETLRNIKKKVEKRIKNTIMRTLQAPAKGAKPRLVCWINIE